MKLNELITEMAKRTTADAFIKAAKDMFGVEKLQNMKWSDIDQVAKKSELQIPPSIRAMKSGRGTWNLSGVTVKDAPKTEPSLPEKKLNLEHLANQVYDAFKRHPLGKHVRNQNAPEKSGSIYQFDLRDWGNWENPQDEEDEEDYDWQVMTDSTRKAAGELCKNMEKTFLGIEVRFGAGEKNYLEVSVSLKK